MRSQWSTGKYDTQADSPQTPKNLSKKNQHEQVGTQNRAAQLSLARRGQRQRWTGHRTCRRKSTPGNTSMNQEKKGGYEETTPGQWKKMKANGTHPPFCGDGPHGLISGQRGGPTATFWPNPSTVHGCIAGTGLADIHDPSGGDAGSSTCQTGSRSVRSTTQSIPANSPS